MRKQLFVCAFAVVLASCASSRSAGQDGPVSASPSGPSSPSEATSTGPGATASAPSTDGRQQASAELANARGRLQEAQRELELARSEAAGADAQVKAARAQMENASKAMDSIGQARADEVSRAAEIRADTAEAHVDYATKLFAARQADVDAAQLATQGGGAVSVSPPGTPSADQRAAAALPLEKARARAAELGQSALEAQRRWEEATQRARASRPGDGADPVGTRSNTPNANTTGTGTSAQPPPSGIPGGR